MYIKNSMGKVFGTSFVKYGQTLTKHAESMTDFFLHVKELPVSLNFLMFVAVMIIVSSSNEDKMGGYYSMKTLLLPNGGTEILNVHPEDVVYVRADGNYCIMTVTGGFEQELWISMKRFASIVGEQLNGARPLFIGVGRSLVVNMSYIYRVNPVKGELVLFDSANPAKIELHASSAALSALREYLDTLNRE